MKLTPTLRCSLQLPTKKPKVCGSRIEELSSMSNVVGWFLAGDHDDSAEVLEDVDTPNKHLPDQHLELLNPGMEVDSEVASVVAAASAEVSVATEEVSVTVEDTVVVEASATKVAVALVAGTAVTRVVLHLPMHPADQVDEVGMEEEGTKTDATATEATVVEQEATKIPLVVETVGMIETAIGIETETGIAIVTDTAEADAMTTMARRENGTMTTKGPTIPGRDDDTDVENIMHIGRCLLQLLHHGWLGGYHSITRVFNSYFLASVLAFCTTW